MKILLNLMIVNVLCLFITSCHLTGKSDKINIDNYNHLPKLEITFDGNGICWEAIQDITSFLVFKNNETWKRVENETFIITVGEKGEFRVLGFNEAGKPSYISEIIKISTTN